MVLLQQAVTIQIRSILRGCAYCDNKIIEGHVNSKSDMPPIISGLFTYKHRISVLYQTLRVGFL